MARTACRPEPAIRKDLSPRRQNCPACGQRMWLDYTNHRTVVTLAGCTGLNLAIRRCHNPNCGRHLRPYRPEGEGRIALPKHEFGLDVIALVGTLRYAEHRSVPEIHQILLGRDVGVSQRTVTNLLDRYDELLAVALGDDRRLRKLLAEQGRVVLAIDGLQPDVGHEVLWVIRDCLSGEVLLARSLRRHGKRTWPGCWPRCVTPSACRSSGWSPTASIPSARRSPGPCRGCRTSCASSTTCARRPDPSTRPTATRRRS